jgi:two-component system phosphate regulon response regulator OmpR
MKARIRLLVVDDDPDIRAMLHEYLGGHGFDVSEAGDGAEMRRQLEGSPPEVVLLDIRLPGEDGLALARYLRDHYDLGLIMVTASGDVVDRVVGLEVGADDYISKPFELRELLARLRSLLRRLHTNGPAQAQAVDPPAAPPQPPGFRPFGRCEVDLESHRLFNADGAEVPITTMEFDLLKAFLANPNRVLTRDQLLLQTRNREWGPFDRSIDTRIGRLRRKVEPDPAGEPRCIRTVRNAGYMFVPNLRSSSAG